MRRFLYYTLALGSTALALKTAPPLGPEAQAPLQAPWRAEPEAASPLNKGFEKYVRDLLDRWHVPGVAVAVIDGNKTWTKGYGIADITSNTPVTPHTLFYTCSTTKAFTGAAAASLVHSKQYKNPSFPESIVDWKTPIADIIPEDFVLQDGWATTHLTLEDALTHRTGMPRHDRAYGGENATARDIVHSLRYLPLTEAPRTKYQYCNLMFMVASVVIETLTSRWLGDVLKDWIWTPLGMNETFFDIQDAYAAGAHVATGYYWHPDQRVFKVVPYMRLREVTGAGAILSSVTDYSKWVRSLIHEAKPLSKEVHTDIKTPRVFDSTGPSNYDGPSGYALGWSTTTYKGLRIWNHDGGADAWGAEVTFLPDLGFGVVTFANTGLTSNAIGTIISYKLLDDKLGLSQEKRAPWEDQWEKIWDGAHNGHEGARKDLFPNLPKKPIAPSLPLEAYTGTYFHPAFRNSTIHVAGSAARRRSDATLRMYRHDAVWALTGEIEHVSGEFWIMYSYLTNVPVSPFDVSPIEFKTGVDGKVVALTIEFGYAPGGKGGEGVFTFEKIA